nr:ubiquitin-like-specific protease 1A [Lolium perenne]
MDLFPDGSEEAKFFATIPDVAATSGGSCVVVTPVRKEDVPQPIVPAASTLQEAKGNASSGPDTHDKKQRQKRVAKDIDTPPKFQAVFKPRQHMDNQVMSLYVEKFNIENKLQASTNKRCRKKFAFSVHMTSELIKDPAKFQTKYVIQEFKIACEKYKISKMDLLWFPIVHEKHWATCCINLMHSQINSFDSIKPSKKGGSMESAMNNLITNFDVLAKETKAFSFDITKFKHGGPTDYPQQPNNFDCGFFVILYMENFDGKVMENFDENGIPYFRMILATDLITHPTNTEDYEKIFEEETYE